MRRLELRRQRSRSKSLTWRLSGWKAFCTVCTDLLLRNRKPLAHLVTVLRIGIYLCLFLAALPILVRKNALKSFSSAVFFMGNTLMFVLISINCCASVSHPCHPCSSSNTLKADCGVSLCAAFSVLALFDTVIAFAYQADVTGPIRPFNDTGYWLGAISMALAVGIVMIGDILMVSLRLDSPLLL